MFCIISLDQNWLLRAFTITYWFFMIDLPFLNQMSIFFAEIWIIIGSEESKKKFSDDFAHNILELYNVSVQIWSTTNKTKCDIHYSTLGIRVTSRVVERLKTKLSLLQGEKKHIEDLAKKDIKPTQTNGALHHKFIDESDRQLSDQNTQ